MLYRQAQMKSKLTYKERKSILDSRSQPQEEMTLREFEEEMQEEWIVLGLEAEAVQAKKEYRKEIEKSKVPLYGNL